MPGSVLVELHSVRQRTDGNTPCFLRGYNRSNLEAPNQLQFAAAATYALAKSTCTEWSTTKSTWQSGLIFSAWPPNSVKASRIPAKSTTTATPVRSCNRTLAGLNGMSLSTAFWLFFQSKIFSMSLGLIEKLSQFLTAASNRTLIDMGNRSVNEINYVVVNISGAWRFD